MPHFRATSSPTLKDKKEGWTPPPQVLPPGYNCFIGIDQKQPLLVSMLFFDDEVLGCARHRNIAETREAILKAIPFAYVTFRVPDLTDTRLQGVDAVVRSSCRLMTKLSLMAKMPKEQYEEEVEYLWDGGLRRLLIEIQRD